MAIFTKNQLEEKNNVLLIVTIILILVFSIFVMWKFENLIGVLVALACIIISGVSVIIFVI
tara:strand:- start:102 stop:284 length:183 start_codon:yes stop_codon:yes gene_type:complete